jgi:hypothetical protein
VLDWSFWTLSKHLLIVGAAIRLVSVTAICKPGVTAMRRPKALLRQAFGASMRGTPVPSRLGGSALVAGLCAFTAVLLVAEASAQTQPSQEQALIAQATCDSFNDNVENDYW